MNTKIDTLVYSGSLSGAISKFNIKYEMVDTSSIEKERKAIRTKAIKIATSVINDAKKLPEWDNCYGVYNDSDYYDDEIESWNVGINNEIPIIWYNYEDNITDDSYFWSEEFSKVEKFVSNTFTERIKKEIPQVVTDLDGDSDFGWYSIKIK